MYPLELSNVSACYGSVDAAATVLSVAKMLAEVKLAALKKKKNWERGGQLEQYPPRLSTSDILGLIARRAMWSQTS